jgi:hypothetical protein
MPESVREDFAKDKGILCSHSPEQSSEESQEGKEGRGTVA